MPRLSRKLRVCKWAGAAGCALILAVFLWSGWCKFVLVRTTGQDRYLVSVSYGIVTIARLPGRPSEAAGWHQSVQRMLFGMHFNLASLPTIELRPTYRLASIPLWLPFLVFFVPTLLLWRRDRRKPRPGHCPRCGYDLTGNTSGRCPECGLGTQSSIDAPVIR